MLAFLDSIREMQKYAERDGIAKEVSKINQSNWFHTIPNES